MTLKDIYEVFIQVGVKTDPGIKAGHIVNDNLGMNLILDRLAKNGKVDVMACSGLRRVKR